MPLKVRVPAPVLVRAQVPLLPMGLARETLLDWTSKVPPAARVTVWVEMSVAACHCKVPPFRVIPLAPNAARELKLTVPALRLMPPEKVLEPVRVSVPLPILAKVPEPE